MEELLERAGSRFALVALSGMRASEINDYYNQLGEGLGTIVPPQVTSMSSKPLSIAMEEIEFGKIEAVPLPTDEELAAEAARAGSAAPGADDAAHRPPRDSHESLWRVRAAPRPRTRRKQF
jgi:DNA-directed RNA polymerase subunit omega